ncbi:UDP-glucose dehydrogenase family protein [Plastoroseomonas hellenica]|uniref:UDP-glucose dehydrogenase family protein n=1 Tax=Plastoroseomonas hellenica TaxID=2687306 RepID=UPI001BA9E21B|nr:UDP-glucose/GDP-mannose dehydrogenase family protein [Plastoroseomonas hellenica]MBR0642462.1 UDP-glucose/GDP-mannose dehydrogenase family protein [Plastoroseomonas hellenica]
MRITMIGAGYVGLVSGACFAEFGHDVVVLDKDPAKIEALQAGRIPIYEPGLEKLVADNVHDRRLHFTTDLAEAVGGAEAVFLAVGTPTRRGDGHADLTYVFAAAEEVARALTGPTVLVTKSTVPVGTGAQVREIVRRVRPDLTIDVASNPEFLREGNAIGDFMRPDRVVIGVESERAEAVLKRLYRPLYLIETPVVATAIETAEMIKYAANAFLAMKITFINEVADLCEKVGADVHDVARGIGLDGRIGRKFLHPGPGYGGSCFPKDTLAFARTGQDYGRPLRLVEATVAVNEARKEAMAARVIEACGGDVAGKTIAVLGLTFKPETDDMRESPSLTVLPLLAAAGAKLAAFDPAMSEFARQSLPASVRYAGNALGAAEGADAVVLLTEWNEFRALSPQKLKAAMRGDVVLDLRNVWDPVAMREAGFRYHSIGRPKV